MQQDEVIIRKGIVHILDGELGYPVYSEEELEQTQISGFGITDKEMFRQAVDILKTKQQPFFSFMITLTNHIPYE